MEERDVERDVVRTRIVGRPGSGRQHLAFPRGIEVLIKKAAVDEGFRQNLLARRGGAAAEIGLSLDAAESAILGAIPEEHLARIIGQTVVPAEQRRAFSGQVAAAMLVALGVGLAASQPSQAASTEQVKLRAPSARAPSNTSGSLYWIGAGGSGGGGAARPPEGIGPGPHGSPGSMGPDGPDTGRGVIVIPATRPATGTATAPGATRPVLNWNDAAAVEGLVKELSDDDYAVRERGQKVLDAIPVGDYDKVQALADKATDLEAKTRLADRADAMAGQRAIDAPHLSLDLQKATLDEVAAAFSKALGVALAANAPAAAYRDERYTISVKDKSFWEILKDGPFWVGADAVGGMKLLRDPAPWNAMQIHGGVCIAMDGPRKPTAAVLARGGASVSLSTSIALALDPRVAVTEIRPPVLTSATDQAGHALAIRAPAASPTAAKLAAQKHMLSDTILWTQAPDEAAAMTSISIAGTWTVVVSVPDPKTGGSKELTVTIPFDFKQLPVH